MTKRNKKHNISPSSSNKPAGTGGRPNEIIGTIKRKSNGLAWLVAENRSSLTKDAFVPPEFLKDFIDGDKVSARVSYPSKGPCVDTLKLLSRGRETVSGTVKHSKKTNFFYLEVDDNIMDGTVEILPSTTAFQKGDLVDVKIYDWNKGGQDTKAAGHVVHNFGKRGVLSVEIERLITQSNVRREFPDAVKEETKKFKKNPLKKDFKGREDFRHLPIVTIDGETAKDFDDAVYAKKRENSPLVDVLVCVADVSHYVKDGSELDKEAVLRGTSIYYPGRVIPMLPEELSNGLCSLKPRVPRLVSYISFVVDPAGKVSEEKLGFGVIESRGRLTYSLVQRFLDITAGNKNPFILPEQPAEATLSVDDLDDETKDSLVALTEVSKRLRGNREKRGALDFEIPELMIELDEQKEPTGLRYNERIYSQKLIEDLMIAANEAAARFFIKNKFPSIFRVHEEPDADKLMKFLALAKNILASKAGRSQSKDLKNTAGPAKDNASATDAKNIMKVMSDIGDDPSREALDMLLLRSMKQAVYTSENLGHYGLASEAYLHFTSPIRRYPDLIVHRMLRRKLEGDMNGLEEVKAKMEELANSSTEAEKKATEIERAVRALCGCWLMQGRVGEVFSGTVININGSGVYVRLDNVFVDGFISIREVGHEYYRFDQEAMKLMGDSGDTIGIGSKIQVQIGHVDMGKRTIGLIRNGF